MTDSIIPPSAEAIQWHRYYWIATMSNGSTVPQFDQNGRKMEWKNLPDKPTKIVLVPFSKDLALKVRSASRYAALETDAKPVELEDFGAGIMAGEDQRRYITPLITCTVCGHTWPFNPSAKAECPACHIKDEWFCTTCQAMREPLVVNNKYLCPSCKSQGLTRGLKRIMKFRITQSTLFDTQYWIRAPPVEVRIMGGKTLIHARDEPLPEIRLSKEQTQ